MAQISIKYDPQNITRPENHFIDLSGRCALDLILDEVHLPLRHLSASLNGRVIKFPVSDDDGNIVYRGDEELLTKPLDMNDELKIVCHPKISGTAATIIAVVASVVAVGVAVWAYSQSYNSTSTDTSTDSKTTLEGQTNTTNLYKAIPDRYGESVIYPDLIDNEAYSIYDDNTQILTQFMCLGVGEFDFDDVYLGDTQIGTISGATVNTYTPVDGVTTIPDYYYQRSVSEVSRSDLDGPGYEKSTLAADSDTVLFTYDSTNDLGRIDVGTANVNPVLSSYFAEDDEITLTYADNILGETTYTYTEDTNDDGVIDENDDPTTTTTMYDLSGTYTVAEVGERYIVFADASTVVSDWQYIDADYGTGETSYQTDTGNDAIIIKSTSTDLSYQGPYSTAIPAKGIILNFRFYSGLVGSVTVTIDIDVATERDGDPIYSTTETVTYTGSTAGDQLNYTYTYDYGDTDDNSYYFSVQVARTSEESDDTSKPDTIKWDSFAAAAEITNKTFSYGPTMIKVVLPYSSSALDPNSNEVNLTGTRKTVTYDRENDEVITTLSATTSFADALLHLYTQTHGRDASELDLEQLYDISDNLGTPLNYFSYSFDDLDDSLEDKIDIICNVARVSAYWDGQKYRFYHDAIQSGNPMIIARTDIAHPDDRDYTRTYSPSLPTSYDSIKLEYVYPDRNNESAYIRLNYDDEGNISTGLGVNPYSITLSGCRNKAQATNRAQLEIRKLLYQRWTLQDTLMKSAYLLDIGDLVQYADVFRTDVYSGEILNVDGSDLQLSSYVTLEADTSYELWYNDEEMEVYGPYSLENGDGTATKTVTISDSDNLDAVYTRGGLMGDSVQVGSRFTINKVSDGPQELFVVSKKEGVDDQHVTVTFTQYDERVYAYDGA